MIFDDFLLILLSHWVDECLKDNLQTAKLAQLQLKKKWLDKHTSKGLKEIDYEHGVQFSFN